MTVAPDRRPGPAPAGMPPTREYVLNDLTESILEGHVARGAKLPSERQLAERYGLSRPIVREVLRTLQERGLIQIAAGRGAFVRDASTSDLASPMDLLARQRGITARDLVQAREMLERQAAYLAAEQAQPDDLTDMRTAVEAFDTATGVIDRARADLAFHALVARASQNPVIGLMFGSVAGLVFELMLRSLDDPAVVKEGGPLHRRVFDAIAAGDADAAAASMHRHITLAYDLFGADLDEPLERVAQRKVNALFGPGVQLEDVISQVVGARG